MLDAMLQVEEERGARRKQDEALRVLWSEVGRLRLFQSARAAVVIQKVWREGPVGAGKSKLVH